MHEPLGGTAIEQAVGIQTVGVIQSHRSEPEAVEQRGGNDGIAEHLAPLGEAAVGGKDRRPFLLLDVDKLEEQVGVAAVDGEVSEPSSLAK